jgi:hypothetical protein
MQSYSDIMGYMRQLIVQSAIFNPTNQASLTDKQFITLDMDEMLVGQTVQLPQDNRPFIIWINHQTMIGNLEEIKDQKKFVFYVLQRYEKSNYAAEEAAREATERAVQSLLNRMSYDSTERLANNFWKSSLNKLKAEIHSTTIKQSQGYVGWMVVLNPTFPYNTCVQTNQWHDLNP